MAVKYLKRLAIVQHLELCGDEYAGRTEFAFIIALLMVTSMSSLKSLLRLSVVLLFVFPMLSGCGVRKPDVAEPVAGAETKSNADTELAADVVTLADLAATPGSLVKIKSSGDSVGRLDLRDVVDADELVQAIAATVRGGTVSEVLLKGSAVTDDIVKPLIDLPSLRQMRAEQTSLGDSTTVAMAEANQMELLYLTDASELSKSGVTALGQMTKLRNLRVGGKAVDDTSVVALGNLKNLAALGLLDTAVTDEGLKSLVGCTKIKELMLFATPVTDASFATLGSFSALKVLRLRQSAITGQDAAALAKLNVVDLELAETDFGNAGMTAIARMPKLTKVNLWLTKIDNEGVGKLKGMTQLTSLNLDNLPPVNDDSIDTILTLPNLTFLHLGKTTVTPAGLKRLIELQKLETLMATQLNVSNDQAAEIKQAMQSLKRFDY